MQLILTSAEISCEHCIETIRRTVDAVEGARFVHGDPVTKQFAIEVTSGALLDAVSQALAAEGYPLGDAPAAGDTASIPAFDLDWQPAYRVTKTDVGADVNYACPCSCDAGFALDRAKADQDPESCCCGRQILVGADAERRLRRALHTSDGYTFDVQTVEMPWGQPLPVALAVPRVGPDSDAHASGN